MRSEVMPSRRATLEDKIKQKLSRPMNKVAGEKSSSETYEAKIKQKLLGQEGNDPQSIRPKRLSTSKPIGDADFALDARPMNKVAGEKSSSETYEAKIKQKLLGQEGKNSRNKTSTGDADSAFHDRVMKKVASGNSETYEEKIKQKLGREGKNSRDKTSTGDADSAFHDRLMKKVASSNSETYEEKIKRKLGRKGNGQSSDVRPEHNLEDDADQTTDHVAVEQDAYFQVSNICFDHVFADLQSFKQENGNSLTIPVSHSLFSQLLDKLTSLGMEDLLKKRWDYQLAGVKAFRREHGDCLIPLTHPTLGAWAATQGYHYKLYEQGLPTPLTKKRFNKLQSIGFDKFVNWKETNKNGTESVNAEGEKHADSEAIIPDRLTKAAVAAAADIHTAEEKHPDCKAVESEVTVSDSLTLNQKIQLKKKSTKSKLAAAENAKKKDANTEGAKSETGISDSLTLNQRIQLKKKATKSKLAAAENTKKKDANAEAKNETSISDHGTLDRRNQTNKTSNSVNKFAERGLQAQSSSEKMHDKKAVAAEMDQKRKLLRSARGGFGGRRATLDEILEEDAESDDDINEGTSRPDNRAQLTLSQEFSFKLDDMFTPSSKASTEFHKNDMNIDSWSDLGGVLALAATKSIAEAEEEERT